MDTLVTSNVETINISGTDLTVVNAARVSFGKRKTTFDEKDKKLIQYLAKNKHFSPFRHAHATFCITCPIFVARQIHKHQVGMSVNEVSYRYVKPDRERDQWDPILFRKQNDDIKQGSSEDTFDPKVYPHLYYSWKDAVNHVWDVYEMLISAGVCREQARAVLPVSTMTSFWMTGSLEAWAHFCNLRVHSHAQKEVQEYGKLVDEEMKKHFPHSWEALRNEP